MSLQIWKTVWKSSQTWSPSLKWPLQRHLELFWLCHRLQSLFSLKWLRPYGVSGYILLNSVTKSTKHKSADRSLQIRNPICSYSKIILILFPRCTITTDLRVNTFPLIIVIILFRWGGKITHLQCRQQQIEIVFKIPFVFLCICPMFRVSIFIRIWIDLKYSMYFSIHAVYSITCSSVSSAQQHLVELICIFQIWVHFRGCSFSFLLE